MASYTTNYVLTPVWYTAADTDVVAHAAGAHAVDINITCIVNTGNVQLQIKDQNGAWFTPAESSYTVIASNLIRLPRANMPDVRILATADATFAVHGSLR